MIAFLPIYHRCGFVDGVYYGGVGVIGIIFHASRFSQSMEFSRLVYFLPLVPFLSLVTSVTIDTLSVVQKTSVVEFY